MTRKIQSLAQKLKISDIDSTIMMKPLMEKTSYVLDSPHIPKEVKERVIAHMGDSIDELSSYTPEDVVSFMNRQKFIAQSFLPDTPVYFLEKIIALRTEEMCNFIPGLLQAYEEARVNAPIGQSYQSKNL